MSKAIGYEQFCKHYDFDVSAQESKNEYKSYCNNLNFVNSAVADKTTYEALTKAKTTTT
ncbi:MAG: hypothetical protein ACI9T7_003523 [Oleiphilaceae bacterium]|jgi:hypothetical protein